MNGVWFPSSPPDSQLKRTYSDSVVPTNYRLSAIDKIYRAQYESFKGNFSLEGSEFEKELIKFYKSKQKFLWVISRIQGESLLKFLWAEQKNGGPIPYMLDRARDGLEDALRPCSLTAAEIDSLKKVSFLFIFNNHNQLRYTPFPFITERCKLIRITDLDTFQGYIDEGIPFTTKTKQEQLNRGNLSFIEVDEEIIDLTKV